MFKLFDRITPKLRLSSLPIAFAVISVLGAFALFISSTEHAVYEQGSFVIFFMSEIAIILFIIPLLAVNRMEFEMRIATSSQFLSAQTSLTRIAIKVIRYPLLITIILCLIPGSTALIIKGFSGGISAVDIIQASLVISTIAVFALSVGFYCSTVCKNAFSAAGFALLILALICTEPIWFGPVINSIPNQSLLIQSSLLMNPFIGVASALNFDILRTDPFYQICPIGQLRFHYPSWWSAASFNVLIALAIFWRFAIGIRRMIAPTA
jgi:hypothetical protein